MTSRSRTVTFSVAALATASVALAAGPASAHIINAQGAGFAAGLAHPLGGLDHLLAMVAVGLWATQLGGRALWAVPGAFVGMMAVGGAISLSHIGLPAVELGIAGSLVFLGLLVATATKAPTWVGCIVVALFAVFHGHAHGAELPEAAQPILYAAGFVIATAFLHGVGIAAGLTAPRLGEVAGRWAVRGGGAAVAVMGAAFLATL
jgi:urease accessory protein